MTSSALFTFVAAVFALSLKPGPGMMMVMSRTIARGMPACYAFLGGFLLITFLYLVLVLVGLQFANFDIVFISILIKSFAAAYLIWMGINSLQQIDLTYSDKDLDQESLFDTFIGAIMLTASNPLVIVFYAGIVPSLVNIAAISFDDMALIVGIVLLIEGGMVLAYCLPLALFRKKIPVKFLKGLRVFSSIMMILIGLYIGYTAVIAEDLRAVF